MNSHVVGKYNTYVEVFWKILSTVTCRNKKLDDYLPIIGKIIAKPTYSMMKDRHQDSQSTEKSKIKLTEFWLSWPM